MTVRTEIFTDGSRNDQNGAGGWAAVAVRTSSGREADTSSYAMELRALVEAVKLADGPCTVICDYDGMVCTARHGRTPEICKPLWNELYTAMVGKDVEFEWRPRSQSLGQRLAHQFARDAARAP
jgi:ribonuclease HI